MYPYFVILSNCANTGDPTYCSQIVRQPTTGSLTGNSNAGGGYVIQKEYNLGTAVNAGIDLQLGYHLDLPPGLRRDIVHDERQLPAGEHDATHTRSAHLRLRGALRLDLPDGQSPLAPYFPHHLGHPLERVGLAHLALYRLGVPGQNTDDPTLHYATWGAYDFYNAKIPAYNYIDLEATWNVNKVLQLRAGANNVLDKDPPLIDSNLVAGGAANTYSVYDIFGRTLFVAFTAKAS